MVQILNTCGHSDSPDPNPTTRIDPDLTDALHLIWALHSSITDNRGTAPTRPRAAMAPPSSTAGPRRSARYPTPVDPDEEIDWFYAKGDESEQVQEVLTSDWGVEVHRDEMHGKSVADDDQRGIKQCPAQLWGWGGR